MMKIITGYLPQTSGVVKVNGLDVIQNSLEVRKHIGYLPEHNPLYLEMYVKEYLEYVAGIYKLGRRKKIRVGEMVELTGLGQEQNKKIGTLSKGYRQRVGLAQALIHDPSVLILDEPTTGLDPNQLEEVRKLIREIGRDKTVMLSTHIMQEVEAICERVIIINKGELVADGTNAAALHSGDVCKQQVEVQYSTPVSVDLLQQAEFVSSVKELGDNRFLLSGKDQEDIRPLIFDYAVKKQLVLLEMQTQKMNMEKIFRELTRN
jgi:ABC-2 type transport system ATP-binding protein